MPVPKFFFFNSMKYISGFCSCGRCCCIIHYVPSKCLDDAASSSTQHSLLKSSEIRQKANVKVTFYAIHFSALNTYDTITNKMHNIAIYHFTIKSLKFYNSSSAA